MVDQDQTDAAGGYTLRLPPVPVPPVAQSWIEKAELCYANAVATNDFEVGNYWLAQADIALRLAEWYRGFGR